MALLSVQHLSTSFFTDSGERHAVRNVSFSVSRGETFALVGESGSGKSVTALSILGLIGEPGRITAGDIIFDGQSLRRIPASALRAIRGRDIAIIFQEPLTALNPVMTIGQQIEEQIRAHVTDSDRAMRRRVYEAMEEVHLENPSRIYDDYPHTLSGGMRQRAMIAMALSLRPALLIADEPTTALDVTIQAEILALLGEIKMKTRMTVLFITHDLRVVSGIADTIGVMRRGALVECGPARRIFNEPEHEYTRELFAAIPRIPESFTMYSPKDS